MKKVLTLIIILFTIKPSFAIDFEDLCKDGYAVVLKTYISGEFNGCDYDKHYKLDNGSIFECKAYNYSYHYHPEFFVLKNIKYGDYKYIIDDEEYDGNIHK